MRILLIEDSERLRESLTAALQESGFATDTAADGETGLQKARLQEYGVVLLDIMLPKLDGLSVLRQLRDEAIDTKIIILSAKDTVLDRVNGLNSGADDYISKPFHLEELLARVYAQCRRFYGHSSVEIEVADLVLDTISKKASRAGVEIELTAREYTVLEYFMMRKNSLITRTELESCIYSGTATPMSNAVDSLVYSLRKKLTVTPSSPQLIHTRRGQGYILEHRVAFAATK